MTHFLPFNISFVSPGALWLLLVLLLVWGMALLTPRWSGPFRFWASLVLRTALITMLVLGLAGMQIVRPTDRLTTVFLVDRSESITPEATVRGEQFVRDALVMMPPEDRAGVVLFGENAVVERAATVERQLTQFGTVPVANRTNIQDAVELGVSLFPADTNKRLVLLSDGGENDGKAEQAVEYARSRGVEISYVDLSSPSGAGEALLGGVDAPGSVRLGQSVDLTVSVESNVAQVAHLRVFEGDQIVLEQDVPLQQGTTTVPVTVQARAPGFQRYRAELSPQSDGQLKNNVAEALIRVDGAARVLLVEGTPGEAQPLRDALAAAQFGAETVAPAAVPGDLAALAAYDAVVLVNVPATALPQGAMQSLPSYVRDLGRGLMMIGGDKSYGIGGYGNTPIAEVLPVTTDTNDQLERPDVAIVFVLDKSASMNACHCRGPDRDHDGYFDHNGPPKVDIAKEAIAKASALLTPRDTVGVVAFDWEAFWAVPMQQDANVDAISQALAPIEPKGGSNIYAGLANAEQALLNSPAKIKHVITMTDGWTHDGDPFEVVRRMRSEGITVSIVGDGPGSAPYLEQLAVEGGGRYFAVQDMSEVPTVFVEDTQQRLGNYLVETPFTPRYGAVTPVLKELENGLPQLYGYNATTAKQTATVSLYGIDDAPVLAQWQHGLGRVIAWTSDTKGQWAKDWLTWQQFPRFAAQSVGWLLPSSANDQLRAALQTTDSQLTINATLSEDLARDGVDARATLIGADGSRQEIPLTRTGPASYQATTPLPSQGGYIVQVVGTENGQTVGQTTAGLVVPYSAEYGFKQQNPELLSALAQATGGKQLVTPGEVFARTLSGAAQPREIAIPLLLAALMLLPLDILVRRGAKARR